MIVALPVERGGVNLFCFVFVKRGLVGENMV